MLTLKVAYVGYTVGGFFYQQFLRTAFALLTILQITDIQSHRKSQYAGPFLEKSVLV
ncbi:hypothetical protein J23TS9_48480 [Paenibacillus sp. J23TS9]|nr:hypothetical protein J23TS9_48480 [Paenibacillus sp. J23TS9]